MAINYKVDQSYFYGFTLIRVIDGDTVEGLIDIGFNLKLRGKVRLVGINAPEMHGSTRAVAERSRDALIAWFGARKNFYVNTHRNDKTLFDSFGRVLGFIYGETPDGNQECANVYLLNNELAVEFTGRSKHPDDNPPII